MNALTKNTERFYSTWKPNYTIRRTLKNYPGHHMRVEQSPKGPKWVQEVGELLRLCARVIKDLHENQGYTLTLRQLYYQLVQRNFIPNHDTVYKTLSEVLTDARRAGIISWSALEDRNRQRRKGYYENSIAGALQRTLNSYQLDGQLGQPNNILVMAEKDAVSEIIGRVCNEYHVPYMINRGYLSTSFVHNEYKRIAMAVHDLRPTVILYLGDFDPSGVADARRCKAQDRRNAMHGAPG